MHRASLPLLGLVLAVPLLLAGCGGESSSRVTDAPASSGPAPSPTPDPSSSAPVGTGPLAGFPLDLGYPDKNGDDHSAVVVTKRPATRAFRLCRRSAWDPRRGTTHLLGVRFRGEAEYARGRTLTVYPDAGAAGDAVTRARTAVAACPDQPDGKRQGTTHTLVDRSLSQQSVVWTDTFYNVNGGEQQHDTGLVVYEVVRVGRAVLLAYEYGEGNGTPASRRHAIARSVRGERAVVARMRRLT
jgi:hypothetical protein